MDVVVWIIIGLVALIAVAAIVMLIIKIAKMKPEERKELVIQFLIGLVTAAENYFIGSKRGQEKLAAVEQQFYKTAPWFIKLVFKFCGVSALTDLIEEALTRAKNTWAIVNSAVTTEN
jgi:hypothetical protein